jgi:hypothetical protein
MFKFKFYAIFIKTIKHNFVKPINLNIRRKQIIILFYKKGALKKWLRKKPLAKSCFL